MRPTHLLLVPAVLVSAGLAVGAVGAVGGGDPVRRVELRSSDTAYEVRTPEATTSTTTAQHAAIAEIRALGTTTAPDTTTPADRAAAAPQARPAAEPPHDEVLELGCRVAPETPAPAIACRWTHVSHARAVGYRLWRAVDPSDEGRQVVFRTNDLGETHFVDRGVEPGHAYVYVVEAVTAGGDTVARSRPERVALAPEHLRLACDLADADRDPADRALGVGCVWSPSEHPRFAGYRLWRGGDGERTVVFRTDDRRATRHLDRTVVPATKYVYVVEALDAAGDVVGRSDPAAVSTPPSVDHLRLACEPATDGDRRGVRCAWSTPEHHRAAGYRLWRSVDGGDRAVIDRTPTGERLTFFDGDVAPDHTYTYVVEAIDGDGRVVGRGGPVRVAIGRG